MFQDVPVPVPAPVRWRWNDKILIPEQRPINHLLYSVYVIQLNILWEQVRFGPWQWFHLTQAFFFFFLIDWFLQRQLPHIWFFNFSSDWFISKMGSLTCCWYLSHKTSICSSLPPSLLPLCQWCHFVKFSTKQNSWLHKKGRKVSLRPCGFAGE